MNKQTIRLGCGLAVLVLLVVLVGGILLLLRREWYAVQYPGSRYLPDRSTVQIGFGSVLVRQAYRVPGEIRPLYNWYKDGFALIPAGESAGGCLSLQKNARSALTGHEMRVIICTTPAGHFVFVNRSAGLR